MGVEILLQGKAKDHPRIEEARRMIRKKAAHHFRALALDDPEVSVLLTDDAHIRELNAQWRGIDRATDVLSFPLFEPEVFAVGPSHDGDFGAGPTAALGDIVIDVEYAERLVEGAEHRARVADELGVEPGDLDWDLLDEIHFLYIHGLLHLVGHDHAEADEERAMRAAERRLWEAAGNQPAAERC
jgi:probable rRNA maturation factor